MRRVCSVRLRLLVAKETKRLPIGLVCRVCSVCCVWPLNPEADRVSARRSVEGQSVSVHHFREMMN
jgi:hypothetical protein